MRILCIINSLRAGGAEKLVEQTVPKIINRGFRVDVLLLTDEDNVFEENLVKNNVCVHIVPFRKIRSVRNVQYIYKYILNGKYDLVHTHLFPANYWTAMVSRVCNMNNKSIIFIASEHNTHNRRRNISLLKPLEKFIYDSYDLIISISQKTQDKLVAWLGRENEIGSRFNVVENGVDIESIEEAEPYSKSQIVDGLQEDDNLLCMVASFTKQKDQKTIIRALGLLPENVKLLLVGEGPLKMDCISLAQELNFDDRVYFLGYRNDVKHILKTVDIMILSSHWEGLSLSCIEAMASGKPFIGSNVQGIEDVVKSYGLLFNEGDEKELANIIKELLNNVCYAEDVAIKCKERAAEFDIAIMVNRLTDIYKSICPSQ